jgi:allophanate hydrolase
MDIFEKSGSKVERFIASAEAAPRAIWVSRITSASELPADVSPGPGAALANRLLAVKDNIDVAGFATTAACPTFAYQPLASASVVRRLTEAGATVVGKTNLDQFACGLVGTRSPYGEVPNTFNHDFVSGGSSSGSAAAVSLGLVDIALGTDTAGSGRIPAAFNNLVGIKPSRGLLSLSGSVAACRHLDCISIFARTVPEAVAVLTTAAGYDATDPFSSARQLDARFMPERARIGVPDRSSLEFFGDSLSAKAFEQSLELVSSTGVTYLDIDLAPMVEVAHALYEDAWIAERYNAIAAFFDQHQEEMDPVVRTIIGHGKRFSASNLFSAMTALGHKRQAIHPMWDKIDALLVPTAPTFPSRQAVRDEPIERNRELGYYTNFVNLLDLAAIAVPTTFRSDGLPFGVTLIGPACSELRLAELAQRIHAASALPLGASRSAASAPKLTTSFARPVGSTVKLVAVGAHMSGLPLNSQLQQRGAQKVSDSHTAARYRLFQLANSTPPKPGLVPATGGGGSSIAVEVWEMPVDAYGSFVAAIPWPLGIGSIEMSDGSMLQGFVCDGSAVLDARDISEFGGWRAFLASTRAAA